MVGVPVNPAIVTGERRTAAARYGLDPDRRVVVFVGGSLGAARINELAVAFAQSRPDGVQVLHLCGRRYHEEVLVAHGTLAEGTVLVAYEDRMQDAYAVADVVVCRAGSSTLAELCAVGMPSVLIPSPNVTENHQEHNAQGLVNGGAARMVWSEWDVSEATAVISELLGNDDARELASCAKALARMDAAERAADIGRVLV